MRRVCASVVCIVVCLAMASGRALASDPNCKLVVGRFSPSNYLAEPDCVFNGVSYPLRAEIPISGSLHGGFRFYFTSFENFVVVENPMAGHTRYAAGFELGRYVTHKGEISRRRPATPPPSCPAR